MTKYLVVQSFVSLMLAKLGLLNKWIVMFRCYIVTKVFRGAYMGQITPLDLRRTTMLDVSVNSNHLLSGVLLGDLCHL